MIIVTGAAGFIASTLISELNKSNFNNIIAVDLFDSDIKNKNLEGKKITQRVNRHELNDWIQLNHEEIEFIFHLGARTDTAEFDRMLLANMNTEYSKMIWKNCVLYQIPLVYASSAATYGLGEFGFDDQEDLSDKLIPLNPYGDSKNEFDIWALKEAKKPFFWTGIKFFNVYGPNEYHKDRMASVVYHAFNQISKTDEMKLFRSHNPKFSDGGQMRDFVYVKDVVKVLYWLMHHRKNSGIYNLGSGQARSFLDLAKAVFLAMNKDIKISFIHTPVDIRDKYQYFTEAKMEKLRGIGYPYPFTTLETGINDYVINYLKTQKRY
ncbi:MAG: ADP-glyceromanno-heptose 6-epimerase [Flammeovirgaceae bacterium]|nr:ADP-glyceromanno-heptose 6-epimerase [Flammeovirgaceae bacterium]|tara:strand:+ start:7583 stop:8548 length:966 start_codon:yes stop_codon:yes gene_type:complete